MATDSFQVDVVVDVDGNGEGFTPPLDSLFLYFVRFLEDANAPVAVATGETAYSITVEDEQTGLTLLTITDIDTSKIYPLKVQSVNNAGAAIDGDWERWQTNGRIRVAVEKAAEGNAFTALIHITTDTARIGAY